MDDLNELLGGVTEPLKDITEAVTQMRDDAVSSFTQIGDDVGALKDEGTTAVSDLTNTISDIVPKKQ